MNRKRSEVVASSSKVRKLLLDSLHAVIVFICSIDCSLGLINGIADVKFFGISIPVS